MAASSPSLSPSSLSLLSNSFSNHHHRHLLLRPSLHVPPSTFRHLGLQCRAAAGGTGFFTKLGRLIKEKAKSDVEKLFSGFSKTRDNLAVIDELLLYWNLADTDRVLDELEEVCRIGFLNCVMKK